MGEGEEGGMEEEKRGEGVENNKGEKCIEHKAHARVGLVGNPSDLYNGRTICFSISNFWASVFLTPSSHLLFLPHPTHDLLHLSSIHHLVQRLGNEGYHGGVPLLMAICKVFQNYCQKNGIHLHDRNFSLSYDTNIPRQMGLSGSSAIICAALNCLLDFFEVRHLIKVDLRPNLILEAEEELGIVAGLQDRVVQVYGGLVYMDFGKDYMDRLGHGLYIQMDTALVPPLHLIYADNPSHSGKVHSTVRKRWLEGDEVILSSIEELASIALEGRSALLELDHEKLASLMNRNFDLRRRMFGDEVIGSVNIEMVEVARRVGAASKFTGSGGAVVAFCPGGPHQVRLLENACKEAGFVILPIVVAPTQLNEFDILDPLLNV